MSKETKEEAKIEPSNGSEEKKEPEKPITDFKIAEIWIRNGQIMLDASENFWADRCRALGVLELCKDIVKTAQMPKQENKIIPVTGNFLNGVRNIFKKGKR